MSDIKKIKIGETDYIVNDTVAREKVVNDLGTITGYAYSGRTTTFLASANDNIPYLYDGLMVSFYATASSISDNAGAALRIEGAGIAYRPILIGSGVLFTAAYNNTRLLLIYDINKTSHMIDPDTGEYSTVSGCWVVIGSTEAAGSIAQCYCPTDYYLNTKIASCTGYSILANSWLIVTLVISNTSTSALTLNVNSQGALPIYINGAVSGSDNHTLPAGTYLVYCDGTNYYFRTDGKIPNTLQASVDETNTTLELAYTL